KGYVRTEGTPSLLVEYDVSPPSGSTQSFRDYFRYRRDAESLARGYDEGTLVLMLWDARTQDVAYRASATAVIDEDTDQRRLEKAIERMLVDLPRTTGVRH